MRWCETICEQVVAAADGAKDIAAVGVAVPGLIKNGVVEEAPNLPQLKGARMQELLAVRSCETRRINAAVTIAERCGWDGGGAGVDAWEAGQHDPGMDAGRGDRVWALSVCAGGVGGRPYGRDAR